MWPLRRKRKDISSQIAVEEARKDLERTKERTRDVTEVSTALRELREKNHFAEQLASIMGGLR